MKKKGPSTEEVIKEKFCRNDYQKAIWELAVKNSCCGSISEFWSFFSGVDAALSLKKDQVNKIRKHKTL